MALRMSAIEHLLIKPRLGTACSGSHRNSSMTGRKKGIGLRGSGDAEGDGDAEN